MFIIFKWPCVTRKLSNARNDIHDWSSREYNANIELVDGIVKTVEAQVEKYFNDKQTLFIFTSDHGMTDWGELLLVYEI